MALLLAALLLPQSGAEAWKKAEALSRETSALKRDDPQSWGSLADWCERAGMPVEAERCYRAIVKLDPDNAAARAKLGHEKRGSAWEVRLKISAATPEERKEIGWDFDRKIVGPRWAIYTDAPEETARAVMQAAEAVYAAFVDDLFGLFPLARPRRPLRAYVYNDRARFLKEANLPAPWAEGYYDPNRSACLCYYESRKDRSPVHWFVHEAHHQLMAELTAEPAGLEAWLSEGYACYFGASRLVDGELKLGDVDPQTYPAWWRDKYSPDKFFSLADLVEKIGPKWNEQKDPNPFYLQSWLFVHHLIHSERRDAFRKFVVFSFRASGDRAAFERIVGKLADLQEGYLKHAREMRGR